MTKLQAHVATAISDQFGLGDIKNERDVTRAGTNEGRGKRERRGVEIERENEIEAGGDITGRDGGEEMNVHTT